MKQFLITLLLKLLTPSIKNKIVDKKNMDKWLRDSYQQDFIRDYIYKRDLDILQQIGAGISREKYLVLLGQRVELGRLLSEAKFAFDKKKKEDKINILKQAHV